MNTKKEIVEAVANFELEYTGDADNNYAEGFNEAAEKIAELKRDALEALADNDHSGFAAAMVAIKGFEGDLGDTPNYQTLVADWDCDDCSDENELEQFAKQLAETDRQNEEEMIEAADLEFVFHTPEGIDVTPDSVYYIGNYFTADHDSGILKTEAEWIAFFGTYLGHDVDGVGYSQAILDGTEYDLVDVTEDYKKAEIITTGSHCDYNTRRDVDVIREEDGDLVVRVYDMDDETVEFGELFGPGDSNLDSIARQIANCPGEFFEGTDGLQEKGDDDFQGLKNRFNAIWKA
jgi:hypothetical protein